MCATKICALANARSIPIGLITSTRVPEQDQQSARRSKRDDDRADISPSVIPDSEHACPEFIWGDEGPVNG